MADDPVEITDLEVISRYSLAVRTARVDRAELLTALRSDLVWLESAPRARSPRAQPEATQPADPELSDPPTSPPISRNAGSAEPVAEEAAEEEWPEPPEEQPPVREAKPPRRTRRVRKA